MSIVIVGAYGFDNVGDEAMLHIVISSLSAMHPEDNVVVSCVDQTSVNRLHGVDTICGVSPISVLKSLAFLRIGEFAKQIKTIFHMKLLVYGGDSLFTDSKGLKNIIVILMTIFMARMMGSRVILWGVSVGPLNTMFGKFITRVIIKLASIVIVRNERSILTVNKLGRGSSKVKLGVDLLFNILKWKNVPRNTRTDVMSPLQVGLSLRPFPAILGVNYINKDRILINGIVKAFNNINAKPAKVSLLIFSEGSGRRNDTDILLRVKEKFPDNNFRKDIGGISQEDGDNIESIIYSMLSKMSGLDVVVGERFHSLVTAAIAGVPFIAISYDQKVKALARACGMDEYCIDFENEINEDELAVLIESKFDNLLFNYSEVKEMLAENVKNIAKVADHDFNYIKDN
jgi:polysaccharide pyruvyl transferase WcaK-like protein